MTKRFDQIIPIVFPLYPKESQIRVVFDPDQKIIRFKARGQPWRSMALWLVFESAGGDVEKLEKT